MYDAKYCFLKKEENYLSFFLNFFIVMRRLVVTSVLLLYGTHTRNDV